MCKLVKKERKRSEEDEDEILSKLQRDDVSTSSHQQPGSPTYKSILKQLSGAQMSRLAEWMVTGCGSRCCFTPEASPALTQTTL